MLLDDIILVRWRCLLTWCKTLDLLVPVLSVGYTCALQRRILFDVLQFFNENNFMRSHHLVNTFKQVCILACNHLCWQEESLALPSSNDYDWSTVLNLPEESKFIKLLIDVLSQSRNLMMTTSASQSSHNYLPCILRSIFMYDCITRCVFAAQYSIQIQFGQLILHFLCSKRRAHHISAILLLLASNAHLVADFTSNEEFTTRVLAYTQPLAADASKLLDVWKVTISSTR